MADFGGWYMPLYYTSIIDEHITTRTKAGLFDTCHMGEFIVKGNDSKQFLQKLIVNDMNKLYTGKAIYSLMCYENGTTVDDSFIYQLKENDFTILESNWQWYPKEKAMYWFYFKEKELSKTKRHNGPPLNADKEDIKNFKNGCGNIN